MTGYLKPPSIEGYGIPIFLATSTAVRLAGRGLLWPQVDLVVPLEQSVSAYQRLDRGEQNGKLVIEVAP